MEKREKTIQIKTTDKQKQQIEKFVSEVGAQDGKLYTVSSYILKIILERIDETKNKMDKKMSKM